MKIFRSVTILGILIGSAGCLVGCIPAGQEVRIVEKKELEPQPDEGSSAEIAARLLEVRQCLERGETDRARSLIEDVLRRRPGHPEALSYRDKLNAKLYSTVYPGTTLSAIAAYYYNDAAKWPLLAEANGIKSPTKLKPYDRIYVPWRPSCDEGKDEAGRVGGILFGCTRPVRMVLHPVEAGESLEAVARQYYGDPKLGRFLADYNRLEDPGSLKEGDSLKIPVFPPRKQDTAKKEREALKQGKLALEVGEYEKACGYFGSIPQNSPHSEEARLCLTRCRQEGAAHYDRLGEEALRNSEPKEACRCWKAALRLDPGRRDVEKKLKEAEDLVKALDSLSTTLP
jgi:tetratricopeptide (TPR) repeat protein